MPGLREAKPPAQRRQRKEHVLVKGGAVTLAGGVTDPAQIDKATSIAKGVSGVTSVKNALTIREGGQ
jgi:osmotically-inducible protein OsmY